MSFDEKNYYAQKCKKLLDFSFLSFGQIYNHQLLYCNLFNVALNELIIMTYILHAQCIDFAKVTSNIT